jgi:hypothetical protein
MPQVQETDPVNRWGGRMAASDDRFEAKVDRSGEHHLWTGARKADGTGLVKAKGRNTSSSRRRTKRTTSPLVMSEVESLGVRHPA